MRVLWFLVFACYGMCCLWVYLWPRSSKEDRYGYLFSAALCIGALGLCFYVRYGPQQQMKFSGRYMTSEAVQERKR